MCEVPILRHVVEAELKKKKNGITSTQKNILETFRTCMINNFAKANTEKGTGGKACCKGNFFTSPDIELRLSLENEACAAVDSVAAAAEQRSA